MKRLKGVERLFGALVLSSVASIILYLIGVVYYGASLFWFLNWNLLLAWLPIGFVLWLVRYLKTGHWDSWPAILLTLLWLVFLPNSFYIISDLMHLNSITTNNPLFFAVMIFSFSFSGLMLGFISLFIMHQQIIKRLPTRVAHTLITVVIFLCSFAVYLGRYLRWSTWDVVLNPAGVLFDVSDRIINPGFYGQTFQVTLLFFVLLGSMYFVLWNLALAIREQK